MASAVRIVEVSPRDGLQNEKTLIPTDVKADLVRKLLGAGLSHIEVTSFVSPKWVPQLADASELCRDVLQEKGDFYALVPNMRGLEGAMAAGITRIALFTAASEAFCRKNINMSQAESLAAFGDVIAKFGPGKFVRAYVSTAFECPYEGRITPEQVVSVTRKLFDMGVDEVSLGDTIGVAGPHEVRKLLKEMKAEFDFGRIALHFHDTNGTAIANVAEGLSHGISIFDSSAGGLGGCPYAPGAGGNLATEDLVYFLEREGVLTEVDLESLAKATLDVLARLGRAPSAKAQVACLSRANADSCAT